MAVQKRVTKNGAVRWVARWRDPSGKEHSKSFNTRREAKAHVAERERDRRRGAYLPHEAEKITVRELFQAWMDHRPLRQTSVEQYRFTRDRQLGWLADWPAREVTPSDITRWAAQLEHGREWISRTDTGLAPGTVQGILRHVRSAYTWGVEQEIVPKNPVITLPRTDAIEPDDIPTLDEIQTVIKCVRTGGAVYTKNHPSKGEVLQHTAGPSPEVADMLTFALFTGMRVSEISGLIVREVDLDEGIIKVRKQLGKTSPPRRVELKTTASRRDIPIADEIRPLLKAHVAGRRGDDYVFTLDGVKPVRVKGAGDRVFIAATYTGAQRVHFHALRHYFGSALLTAGVPIQDVAEVLGHSSPAFTLKVYTHVISGSRDRIVSAITESIGCGIGAGSHGLRVVGDSA